MSKMSNLYLEQSEIAQNYIGDYADGKYPTIEAAKKAFNDQSSLRDAVVSLGFLSPEDFDKGVQYKR